MAANDLTLTVTKINYNAAGDNADSIDLSVAGRDAGALALTKDNIVVYRSTDGVSFTNLNTAAPATNSDFWTSLTATTAKLDLTKLTSYARTDLYLVQILDNTKLSNRIALDLYTVLGANGTITNPYTMPAEAGSYKITTSLLNGQAFSKESSAFTLGAFPSDATFAIDKPYLLKFVNGTYNVSITLVGSDAGNYEIVYAANKQ